MPPRPALSRLTSRPKLSQWEEDELLTLIEISTLMFPNGPFSASSLRKISKNGGLAVIMIGKKIFTTVKEVRKMSTPFKTEGASDPETAITKTERLIAERVAMSFVHDPERRRRISEMRKGRSKATGRSRHQNEDGSHRT